MQKLYYQPEGYWFGDCMPFGKGDKFFLFHQRDNRNPCPFGEPFGWSLATTADFVHYEDLGEAVPRGGDADQDQFIFAGSVFEAEGRYHIIYTGYNRDYPKLGKASQVLMHAVSDDAVHWEKTKEPLNLAPQPGYDKDDWRDPFVLWDAEKQEYLLILGARKLDGEQKINGCTVKFTSKDLKDWRFEGQFWAPRIYTMHEMPDLFKIGKWWYLIISEYSDKNKIVYRRSESLDGPWLAPTDDAFDGRAYYAGRSFYLNGRRVLFGWVPTREGCSDKGNFEWAGTFMPHEIVQREDGTLGVKLPDTMRSAFNAPEAIADRTLATVDSREEVTLSRATGDIFRYECDLVLSEGVRSFAVNIYQNDQTQEGYRYIFFVGENRFVFEKTPNQPWYQMMNIGLERPFKFEANRKYHITLVVDDTIATMYLDDVALNARMYQRPGETLGMSVTDGHMQITGAFIAKGLK